MSTLEIIDYLGPDWTRCRELIRQSLHTDVGLLEKTNEMLLSRTGKQLRPILALLSARLVSQPNEDSLRLAASAEILHNATLMHDDVADESKERRGAPTLSALLGPNAAVLVGDYWLARAVEMVLSTSCFEKVIPLFSRTLTDLAEGEMLQLEKASSLDTCEEDYLRIIFCKTASLFVASVKGAAISVSASPTQLEAVEQYAKALGVAFQIKDDILDYTGDKRLGKPVGVDLKEKKITLPLLGALRNADSPKEIREMVGRIDKQEGAYEQLMAFVHEGGGIEYATRQLDAWIQKAERALDVFPDSQAKTFLIEIAYYNSSRTI